MPATTVVLPSPQTWSPNITATAVSTTPLGMPPRTPASVGQMTAPMLGSGATLSPRILRDSCNSYFGIVDFTSTNPPSSTPGIHARKAWNFPSGSPNGAKHGNRHSSEYNVEFEAFRKQTESAGFIAGHRISSSFEKQTQALRDRDRRAEERREMQSPASPHMVDASWAVSRYDDKTTTYMSIDPHPSAASMGEIKLPSTFVKPMNPSIVPSPASTIPHLMTLLPLGSEGGNGRPSRITLPPHPSRHSLAVNRARPLQRSETSPASVDQSNVQFIAPCLCAELFKSSSDTTLLLDVRPYPQFTQARIKGALNLCIPTTLLKRPSFNLKKLEDTFAGDEEKKRFARWQQCTRIIVYDSSTTQLKDASTLINVLKKFTSEGWKGEPSIVRGGFTQFSAEFPDQIESNQSNEPANFAAGQPRSISLVLPNKPGIAGGCCIPKSNTTAHPFFSNIRQNMDLIDGVGQIPIKLPPSMSAKTRQMLPQWLARAADVQDKGKRVSEKFLQIERAEQNRMQEALTNCVSYGSPGSGGSPKKTFRIAGLEKGSKNRYNNIYPYDHSRVRLQGVPTGSCDYVNASFIQSSHSNKRYIATQAPIPATFNDFWRVVWEQDIRVIVMLTAESEGPQLKCHPYWKAADYGPLNVKPFAERRIPLSYSSPSPSSSSSSSSSSPSNPQQQQQQQQQQQRRPSGQRRATNPLTQFEKFDAQKDTTQSASAEDDTPHATVRHLTLSHSAYPFQPIREITQLQYSHWPDFGTPADPAHLVRLIEEVNQIAHAANGRAVGAGGGNSSSSRATETTTAATFLDPEAEGQRRILVHCSAGCGRTGTYCTVDSVVDMLKRKRRETLGVGLGLTDRRKRTEGGSSNGGNGAGAGSAGGFGGDDDWLRRDDIDLIAATVEDFRLQRLSMVQSLKQFVLCYESVLEWIALHEAELGSGSGSGSGIDRGFRRSYHE
ncbi:heat shock transcription factor, other eukaryote [[Emmonsia] crescens]|uniref:protein-tyrosine-phosphatase n=1 Tax=[Emmonsia] crescens TaxID=73230 RepID=A0A2B7Z5C5_9EURO|nr:heat shock transcription factor, other eukaryote [Emmonsia crescens]